ncbi:MAG: hypothetical protein KC713_06900, partial [Candidatus Omnitrophica bacterium]|nr:hypothetical protein [Candidatus Omnitrophota bacterium]
MKIFRYFMTALALPDELIWVNLSPYEQNRIMPPILTRTEIGKNLIQQDYSLKQVSTQLLTADTQIGQLFWEKVYSAVYDKLGSRDIPINLYHKIWIVPDSADVYVNGNQVLVENINLNVLLEKDYVAAKNNSTREGRKDRGLDDDYINILKQTVLPEINQLVNHSEEFSELRSITRAVILAAWYKQNKTQTELNEIYIDQKNIAGIELDEKNVDDKIYQKYLNLFQSNKFSLITEDIDPITQEIIPRKYFTGGIDYKNTQNKMAVKNTVFASDELLKSAVCSFRIMKPDALMKSENLKQLETRLITLFKEKLALEGELTREDLILINSRLNDPDLGYDVQNMILREMAKIAFDGEPQVPDNSELQNHTKIE